MRIVFMGTPAAAVPTLEALIGNGHEIAAVYTQPDRPAGRGKQLRESPVKIFATAKGLEILQPEKIRTDEALAQFKSLGADVAIVVAYGRILPDGFLRAFEHGALNLHFSLLPKYRGAAPVNWAIVNGETETGITVMRMDQGLDTGDILLQERTKIDNRETAIEVTAHLAEIGAEAVIETLRRLDTLTAEKQDDSQASFAPIMKKEDGRIDWTMPAAHISNRVRGFQPFPTAFTMFRGGRLTIFRAVEAEGAGDPGTVLEATGEMLLVACGSGSIRIEELQLEGKKRASARDFINGVRPAVGEKLG